MKKTTLVTLSATGIILTGLLTPQPTQAFWPFNLFKSDDQTSQASSAPNRFNFMTTLMERLTERFGLDQAEVEGVFNEVRTENQSQRQAQFDNRLDEAVQNGNLTAEQKTAIMEKHRQMQAERENMAQLDPQERRAVMQEHHTEMQSWAEENNIPLPYQNLGGIGKGLGMPRGQW